MLQQILALLVIGFFLIKLFGQKKKKQVSGNEFVVWLTFWLIAAGAVILIKQIDRLVAFLGFSGSAINILVYLTILALIYQVFRMRLEMVKIEKNISILNQNAALKK